jgi:hypothetical protein
MSNENQITKTPETEKKEFIENVQKWVLVESQLKVVNEKTKTMREVRTELSRQICEYTKKNSLTKIGTTNGELRIYEKKEYPPLTYGYIETNLAKIIPDKSHVDYIIKYLKENREITSSPEIKIITNKK